MTGPAMSGGPSGEARPDPGVDPPPPGLRSWGQVYALVIGWLGLLVLLMYAFTLRYR